MNELLYPFLYLLCTFISSCTQIVLKSSSLKEAKGIKIYLNKSVIISNIIFIGITFASINLYRYMQFTTVTLLNSASYIFVPVLSAMFLKERINKRKLVSMIFIIAGLVTYTLFGM